MRFEELGLEPWVPPAASDLETAQGRLALFLRDLPRLFQRLIVGLNPRGVFDTINEEYLSEQRKGELRQARREYRRLVVAVARELTTARGQVAEARLRGRAASDFMMIGGIAKPRRGGRPQVLTEVRTDIQLPTPGDMLGQHLDGDRAVQAGVGSFVDLPHAAGAEGGVDLVRAEGGAGGEGHGYGTGTHSQTSVTFSARGPFGPSPSSSPRSKALSTNLRVVGTGVRSLLAAVDTPAAAADGQTSGFRCPPAPRN